MCVEAIQRVKKLSKEIRIGQTLTSNKRKIFTRDLRSSIGGGTLSPIRSKSQANLKFKHNSLAEI